MSALTAFLLFIFALVSGALLYTTPFFRNRRVKREAMRRATSHPWPVKPARIIPRLANGFPILAGGMDRTFTLTNQYQPGNSPLVVKGIPVSGNSGPYYFKRLVGHLHLELESALVSDAITGRRLWEAIQKLHLKPKQGDPLINMISGWNVRSIQRSITKRAAVDPSNIAANSNTTNVVDITFVLTFEDDRFANGKEQGVPMNFLADGQLLVVWQADEYFGTGQVISDATFLDLTFLYDEEVATHRAGMRVTYEAVGLNQYKSDVIPAGCITDAVLHTVDGSTAFDEDSFNTISSDSDGDVIHNQTTPDNIIRAANEAMISDTASVWPTLDATVTEEIPLLWPRADGSDMGDCSIADNRFQNRFDIGSAPPAIEQLEYVLRRILPVDEGDTARQVSAVTGISEAKVRVALNAASSLPADQAAGVVKVVTNSKVPLNGPKGARFGRFLPRTVNPLAIEAVASAAMKQG